MKIITIIGTELIKASTVSNNIKYYNKQIKEIIVHTGQHFDNNMSSNF